MKIGIGYESGIGEMLQAEIDGLGRSNDSLIAEAQAVLDFFDRRRWQRNEEIMRVREFINSVEDPGAKIMFTNFMDQMVGVSSQAKPIAVGLDSGELPKDYVKQIKVPKKGGSKYVRKSHRRTSHSG